MLQHRAFLSPDVSKFVMAAERLMFHDIEPQALTRTDLDAIRYYVESVSAKFTQPSAVT
jgi:hypothetical protein